MGKPRRSKRWATVTLGTCTVLSLGLLGPSAPFSVTGDALAQRQAAPPKLPISSAPVQAQRSRATAAQASYDRLPLTFEAAPGQGANATRYVARGNGYALSLTNTDAILVAGATSRPVGLSHAQARTATLQFHLQGANPHATAAGLQQQHATVNYFTGADSRNWQTGVHTYGRVAFHSAYPGINVIYYGTQGHLEYDFQVAPGARPSTIRLEISGSKGLKLDTHGNLIIASNAGNIVEAKPVMYQQVAGHRQSISGHYVLLGHQQVGFSVGKYDASRPLVIDPVLSYSNVFGTYDTANRIALDRAGDAYIIGTTYSGVITTTQVLQPALLGGSPDVFVAKFSTKGNHLLFSTYLGGSGGNYASGIAVDDYGNAYVTGYSNATDFPTTVNAFQPTNRGGADAFIAKISANGRNLMYSTLLGGAINNANTVGDDIATGIAVDRTGSAYVTGNTYSYNFPIKNALLGSLGYGKGTLGSQVDAFVTKLNPKGTGVVYSTYLGGSGSDYASGIALDPSGDAYVVGQTNSPDFQTAPHALQANLYGTDFNSFVVKLNRNGNRLVYATYLGQSAADKIHAIAVDVAGNAFIVGETKGGIPQTVGYAQPISGGGIDAFVAKMSARGVLVYSTYLGGIGDDIANDLAVDGRGNVYITGSTGSASFNTPVFPLKRALQGKLGGNRGGFGMLDAFVAKVNSCGSGLLYSSYFGGTFVDNALGIAVDGAGDAYVAGNTLSPNFPLTHSLHGGDVYAPPNQNAFIAKISGEPQPPHGACRVPLTLGLSSSQISIASAVPLTVTVHTAPFAKVDLALAVINTVPPPPPPTPVPTPTPVPGKKAKPIKPPKLPVYPKVGAIIYRLHVRGTADAYGLYVGRVHPKYVATIAEPATLKVSTSASHSTSSTIVALTVGP
jgi:hypothetical protein